MSTIIFPVGKFKSERDEELDRAVDRLEAEVTRGRKEVEQEYTERIRRLREKYEGELEDLSREIEVHKSKFCKARDDFVSKEEEFIVLSAVVKQKEVTLSELEKVIFLDTTLESILFSSTLLPSGQIQIAK